MATEVLVFRRLWTFAALSGLACSTLFGDFSYEQTAKVTGGMAAMASRFTGQAAEPTTTSVMVKGNLMANVTKGEASLIDLDAETVTEISFDRKTYSVITFAQMKEMMERMTQSKSGQGDFKVSAKETGQSKQIGSFTAKELVITVEFDAKDPASGKATRMTMTSNIWLAPNVPGSGELRAFHEKMAAKVSWAQGGDIGPGGAEMARGMAEIQKQVAKADGVPVLTVVKTTGSVDGQAMPQLTAEQQAQLSDAQKQADAAMAQAREEQAREEQAKPAQDAPDGRSKSAIAGALGGRLPGGFGGFGRKKKSAEPPPQASTPPPPAPPQRAARADAGAIDTSGSLMEMTIEARGFSSANLDASKFEVLAGFNEVDPQFGSPNR